MSRVAKPEIAIPPSVISNDAEAILDRVVANCDSVHDLAAGVYEGHVFTHEQLERAYYRSANFSRKLTEHMGQAKAAALRQHADK